MAGSDGITKGDLQALENRIASIIEEVLTRMLERIDASETRMTERIEASETRMLIQFAALDRKIDDVRMEMIERIEASETRLLTAFQVWAVPVNGRMRKLELGDANLGERLAAIEDRLMNLERSQRPGSAPGPAH